MTKELSFSLKKLGTEQRYKNTDLEVFHLRLHNLQTTVKGMWKKQEQLLFQAVSENGHEKARRYKFQEVMQNAKATM